MTNSTGKRSVIALCAECSATHTARYRLNNYIPRLLWRCDCGHSWQTAGLWVSANTSSVTVEACERT